jgi:hypothetical protein
MVACRHRRLRNSPSTTLMAIGKGPGHKLAFATEATEFRLNDEDGLLRTIFGQMLGFLGM